MAPKAIGSKAASHSGVTRQWSERASAAPLGSNKIRQE
jgi:hypothetical protein